jgi:cell division protein FtsQ
VSSKRKPRVIRTDRSLPAQQGAASHATGAAGGEPVAAPGAARPASLHPGGPVAEPASRVTVRAPGKVSVLAVPADDDAELPSEADAAAEVDAGAPGRSGARQPRPQRPMFRLPARPRLTLPGFRRAVTGASAAESSAMVASAPGAPGAPATRETPSATSPTGGAPSPGGASATILAFPEPAFRRIRRRTLITLAAVLTVIAAVLAVAMFSPALALKTITLDGNRLASSETLQAALAPLRDRPLTQINQSQVEDLLAPVPQISSVSVEARPPSTLLVHIVEREPVALLKSDAGFVLVDPEGVQLATVTDQASAALPLIDGGTAATGQQTFRAITTVLAALPTSVRARLEHASASSPDAVELNLNDGKKIIWGNAGDKELKAKVLESLLNAPAPTALPGKPAPAEIKVYDVSAPRHPVTR